jgi:hypothetical protein
VSYLLYASDGSILDTLGARPGAEMLYVASDAGAMRTEVAFGRASFASVGGSIAAIGTNDRYEFEVLDDQGSVAARVRARTPSCAVTDGDVRAWEDEQLGASGNPLSGLREALVAEMVPRETHPSFMALQVDRLGHVWVGRRPCEAPGGSGTGKTTIWDVYSPEGLPAGRLVADRDLRLLDIGADYILTLSRDDLDREIVRLFDLHRKS